MEVMRSRPTPGSRLGGHSRWSQLDGGRGTSGRLQHPGHTPSMHRASPRERDHFRRVAAANGRLEDAAPPGSLAEVFDRLDRMEERLGALAEAGVDGPDDGDLASHLAYLERLRRIDPAYRTW